MPAAAVLMAAAMAGAGVSGCAGGVGAVGAGPAGLFAALRLIEGGRRPVVLERGKDVRARRFDVAALSREGLVNPESNYCFGEGGAGTFSDGKLYTRSTKRGEVSRILNILAAHGASPDILVDAHPHIGTNRLPGVVQAMRETIVEHGGEVHFGVRVDGLVREGRRVTGVRTAGGDRVEADAVILATGHSARDVYAMLHREGVALEQKPFALGVRVEHPQSLIDRIQYRCQARPPELPPAAYSALRRIDDRGVYSFCMCPGGVICPATTAQDEVVVNGWSPSKRNSRWANSGVVVEMTVADIAAFGGNDPLAGIALQSSIERRAATAGGGRGVAPAQRLVDFVDGRPSADLPSCSYPPGLRAESLADVLPPEVTRALRSGLRAFGDLMRGYLTNEAVVVGVETRTSAPVRIPRDRESCMNPQVDGLFPCGEGAGAAGGIVSAAMDGERCAEAVLARRRDRGR
ncbi:MAG: NAD(P)/FAD-dependent oxidoreductase [Candidatus Binatia bacterium]